MRQRTRSPELVRRTERVIRRMGPEQLLRELATRIEGPAAFDSKWRGIEPVPIEVFAAACLIVQKEGESETGLIPFLLWDEQKRALEVIERERFLVLPKGRQVGITWLELMAMLHAGTFHGHSLFNIARQSGDDAKDAIRRLLILMGYDPNSDPPHMRVLAESPAAMDAWRPRPRAPQSPCEPYGIHSSPLSSRAAPSSVSGCSG